MDNNSLLNMTVTLFRRVENDDDVTYVPAVLNSCFIKVTHGTYYKEQGIIPKTRDESIAVVPISSLSSIDEVSPNASGSQYWGSDVIKIGDYIALGSFETDSYTLNDIANIADCFCIKILSRFDFSSIPAYLIKGE